MRAFINNMRERPGGGGGARLLCDDMYVRVRARRRAPVSMAVRVRAPHLIL